MALQKAQLALLCLIAFVAAVVRSASFDYADALDKSILFYEQMRSGKLPADQRATWRGDSGLTDGSDVNVDLVGGYYDAGNNEKFGLPMAFTATVLAWSAIDAGAELDAAGELGNVKAAVRWATDFLLKAYSAPNVLWAQVGNPTIAHGCWERPEDMDTPRTAYKVDAGHPGSDVAGETAAALAAASIMFQISDPDYSVKLLSTAIDVFRFADTYRGSYSDSLGDAVRPFYNSFSGYKDELLWAAAWLYKASRNEDYLQYVIKNGAELGGTTSTYFTMSWDNKLAGVQVLLSQVLFAGKTGLEGYKAKADDSICSVLPGTPKSSAAITPGGLVYIQSASNLQFVTNTAFLFFTYAKYLSSAGETVNCGGVQVTPDDLTAFAKKQVDYILGDNPMKMSYMVGFGPSYPTHVHQRASSMPSLKDHPEKIECSEGFKYLNSPEANPNPIVGGVVGGPDSRDQYLDDRSSYSQSEPATYINAGMVGALAYISGQGSGYKP